MDGRQREGHVERRGARFHVLLYSAEDGSLDLPDEVLAGLDLVIASPHVKLRQARPEMT